MHQFKISMFWVAFPCNLCCKHCLDTVHSPTRIKPNAHWLLRVHVSERVSVIPSWLLYKFKSKAPGPHWNRPFPDWSFMNETLTVFEPLRVERYPVRATVLWVRHEFIHALPCGELSFHFIVLLPSAAISVRWCTCISYPSWITYASGNSTETHCQSENVLENSSAFLCSGKH